MSSIVEQANLLQGSLYNYIDSDAQLENLGNGDDVTQIIGDVQFYNACRTACDQYRHTDIEVPEIMNFILMCTLRNMVTKKFGYPQDTLESTKACLEISRKNIRKTCTILITVFFMDTGIPERRSDDEDSDEDADEDSDDIFGEDSDDNDDDSVADGDM